MPGQVLETVVFELQRDRYVLCLVLVMKIEACQKNLKNP